jgi:hypothetical protein
VAFAAWGAIVGMVGIAIVWELSRMRSDLKEITARVNQYVLQMERRVTHIEAHLRMADRKFIPSHHSDSDSV